MIIYLLKYLFSSKYKNVRNLLREVHRCNPPSKDSILNQMMCFSHLFYFHGFIAIKPAFYNAYKNITSKIFKETYIALPLYFVLRHSSQDPSFTLDNNFINTLPKKYPTLDSKTLYYLYSEWEGATQKELDILLYNHFRDNGYFRKVFSVDDAGVEKWFINYLNQTYDYTIKEIS